MFGLGVITDEIHHDFEHALDVMRELGMEYAELRSLWGKNIVECSLDDMKKAKAILQNKGIKVSAIAGPLFKCNLPGKEKGTRGDSFLSEDKDYTAQMGVLKRCIEAAHLFGTDMVRAFTFWREPQISDALLSEIAGYFQEPLEMVKKAGLKLAVENEHACCVGDGDEMGRFLAILRERYPEYYDCVGVIWDPGNAFFLDEVPFPDGYRSMPPEKIIHVHVKDARINPATGKHEWAPVGGGNIDFAGNFKALMADGYNGILSLETHYRGQGQSAEEASRESFAGLAKILQELL